MLDATLFICEAETAWPKNLIWTFYLMFEEKSRLDQSVTMYVVHCLLPCEARVLQLYFVLPNNLILISPCSFFSATAYRAMNQRR